MSDPSRQLIDSWRANAPAWASAVRSGSIASRRLATDAAILRAVRERSPARVLDAGCGEGWLVRALAADGIQVTGMDASAPLIELARAEGGGEFILCSYAEAIEQPDRVGGPYDVVVLNFALFEESPAPLLGALGTRLLPGGVLLIQTIHPWSDAGRGRYVDGWRTETFSGMDGFVESMPWYFRTMTSWLELLRESGYRLERLREPAHPDTGEPLSLLLAAVPNRP